MKKIIALLLFGCTVLYADIRVVRNETQIFEGQEGTYIRVEFFGNNTASHVELAVDEIKCLNTPDEVTKIVCISKKTNKTFAFSDYQPAGQAPQKDYHVRQAETGDLQLVQTTLTPTILGYYCQKADVRIVRNASPNTITFTLKGKNKTSQIQVQAPEQNADFRFACIEAPEEISEVLVNGVKQDPTKVPHNLYMIHRDGSFDATDYSKTQLKNAIDSYCQ